MSPSGGVTGNVLRADEAGPTKVMAFNPDICAPLGGKTTACHNLQSRTQLANPATAVRGDVNDADTCKDLVDASAARSGPLWSRVLAAGIW